MLANEYVFPVQHLADLLQTMREELETWYRREQQLMLSALHDKGMQIMRASVAGASKTGLGTSTTAAPTSWLGQQRARANGSGLVRLPSSPARADCEN